MKINPIALYDNKQFQKSPSFGIIETRPEYLNALNQDSPAQVAYPRTFSNAALSVVMANYPLYSDEAKQKIAFSVLKDIRKSQQEADQYKEYALGFYKDFKKNILVHHETFLDDSNYENGSPKRKTIVSSDGRTKAYYAFQEDGKIYRIIKTEDDKLKSVMFSKNYDKTGKYNIAKYREDGTLESFSVGVKPNPDGTSSCDKVFKYDNENELLEGAFDVVRNDKKGETTMTSYFRPDKRTSEYIDRYAGKRTIKDDKSVEYENVLYFYGKQFWSYFPHDTRTLENEFLNIEKRPLYLD